MWLDLLHNEMHDTSGGQRSHYSHGANQAVCIDKHANACMLIKMATGQVNEKLLKRTRTEFVELVKRKKGNLTTEFQV